MSALDGSPREMRAALGARLADLRRGAHFTQSQLADRIGYSRATVAGVESGHQQAADGFWQRCDVILDAGGALVAARQQLLSARRRREQDAERRSQAMREARASDGLTRSRPIGTPRSPSLWEQEPDEVDAPIITASLGSAWPETLAALPELWRLDEDHDQGVVQSGGDGGFDASGYLAPVVRWLTGSREERPEAGGHGAVGLADVGTVREMTRAFSRLDDLFGGGHARDALVRYLNVEVAPMLREGRYGEQTRRALLGAVAELLRLAGWMSYDTGRHGLAQRYLVQGLRLAFAAGDEALGGEILSGMSHHAVHQRQPVLGLDLARAAHSTAERIGVDVLMAEASVMEAHSQARLGDESSCTEAMVRAERALERADRDSAPEWLRYFGEAYLAAKFAHCLRDVGRPQQAEPYAQRSLDMDGRYARGRAFNTALLASIKAEQGEIEQACELGDQAVEMAVDIRSRRIVEYIDDLRARLRRYHDAPVVRKFEQQAEIRLTAHA